MTLMSNCFKNFDFSFKGHLANNTLSFASEVSFDSCIIQVACKTEKTYGAKMASNSSELNSTNNFEYDSVLFSEMEIRAAIENVMNEGET